MGVKFGTEEGTFPSSVPTEEGTFPSSVPAYGAKNLKIGFLVY